MDFNANGNEWRGFPRISSNDWIFAQSLAQAATMSSAAFALDHLQQPVEHGADGAEQGDESEQVIQSLFAQSGFFATGEFSTAAAIGRRAGIALWRRNGVAATEAVAAITKRGPYDKILKRSDLRVQNLRLIVELLG